MGLGLASTALPIQAASGLMRQVGRMNRSVKSQRRVRQKGLDLNAAIFGSSKQVRSRSHKRRRK
jgi:hypothetical protein